jgi:ribosomal protein S18 acetylase RimI-like enzyme
MMNDISNLILENIGIENGIVIETNLEEYIFKLKKFATIIPYYRFSKLIGFVAYYSNNSEIGDAFLTMIVIDKVYRGEGIGKLLLESSIADLSYRGFKNYRLKVLKTNINAIRIYKKMGFLISKEIGEHFEMNLNIKQ